MKGTQPQKQRTATNYECHPKNNFQNDIILLIFKVWKIRDIRFIGNLILNVSSEFHYDDIIVTSDINIIYVICGQQDSPNAIHTKMHPVTPVYGDKQYM